MRVGVSRPTKRSKLQEGVIESALRSTNSVGLLIRSEHMSEFRHGKSVEVIGESI